VVDVDCSVHGIEGLSVADASVMPTVPRGNTNIPVTVIAEHAAERITRNMSEAKHPTSVFRSPDEQ